MNQRAAKEHRVLAIDPTTRGFGFAVLEEPDYLIDWGVKGARQEKNVRCLAKVNNLIKQYQPSVVVLEDCTAKHSRRCSRVRELIQSIVKLASKSNIKTRCFSPLQVRQTFSASGASTKHGMAAAIARQFSELASIIPPPRKPWMSEDCRMNIFDAAALALSFFHFNNPNRSQR